MHLETKLLQYFVIELVHFLHQIRYFVTEESAIILVIYFPKNVIEVQYLVSKQEGYSFDVPKLVEDYFNELLALHIGFF